MGKVVKRDHDIVFQQDNGEITAWLTDFKEKTELSHAGTSFYKKILCLRRHRRSLLGIHFSLSLKEDFLWKKKKS